MGRVGPSAPVLGMVWERQPRETPRSLPLSQAAHLCPLSELWTQECPTAPPSPENVGQPTGGGEET